MRPVSDNRNISIRFSGTFKIPQPVYRYSGVFWIKNRSHPQRLRIIFPTGKRRCQHQDMGFSRPGHYVSLFQYFSDHCHWYPALVQLAVNFIRRGAGHTQFDPF